MTRPKRLPALLAAAALIAGGTGVVLAVAPANADPSPPPVAAPAAVQAQAQAQAPNTRPQNQGQARGTTVVTFDAGAIQVLGAFSPSAIRPGSLSQAADDAPVVSSFPIVGNPASGAIRHVGGLTFTDGPNTVTLLNYTISGTTLTAQAFVNGDPVGQIDFLTLSPTTAVTPCDAAADLTLSAPAGFALASAFGIADLTGATIGTACVDLR
jgi:hypothetical protein